MQCEHSGEVVECWRKRPCKARTCVQWTFFGFSVKIGVFASEFPVSSLKIRQHWCFAFLAVFWATLAKTLRILDFSLRNHRLTLCRGMPRNCVPKTGQNPPKGFLPFFNKSFVFSGAPRNAAEFFDRFLHLCQKKCSFSVLLWVCEIPPFTCSLAQKSSKHTQFLLWFFAVVSEFQQNRPDRKFVDFENTRGGFAHQKCQRPPKGAPPSKALRRPHDPHPPPVKTPLVQISDPKWHPASVRLWHLSTIFCSFSSSVFITPENIRIVTCNLTYQIYKTKCYFNAEFLCLFLLCKHVPQKIGHNGSNVFQNLWDTDF